MALARRRSSVDLISVSILQFDEASAATVGAITGVMLIYAGPVLFLGR
jgi:hypothetical protein